ncbi:MAG: DNA glycosylase AlkZ-like family protein, partial [Gaiellaceae bacterium]
MRSRRPCIRLTFAGESPPPAEQSVDAAVERYLRAFGPATAADVRAWSGMRAVCESVARLRPRLRSYRDAGWRELLDVEDGAFARPGEAAPVRLLGEYDNAFLGHEDRSRVTGGLAWGWAWARRGAFLVDGLLAGAWRCPANGEPDRVELEAMRRLDDRERRDVEAEAEALVRFLTGSGATAQVAWT